MSATRDHFGDFLAEQSSRQFASMVGQVQNPDAVQGGVDRLCHSSRSARPTSTVRSPRQTPTNAPERSGQSWQLPHKPLTSTTVLSGRKPC